ncbi:MAG: esterase/lipase family protein [Candidatus Limnocylindria bacterium]
MRARALIGATLLAWALLPALALVASADEDPPLPPVDAGPPLRPPLTVLRAVERVATVTTPPGAPKRELIVLVGGYASEPNDEVFDALRERVAQEGYDVVRFGHDLGTYDTFGAVDANAARLRDSVRSVSTDYSGVHLVTHSMGGVVADRAFALGLSASDGVTTYVAWAAPHNGAHAAQALQSALTLSGPAREDTRAFTTLLFRDRDPDDVAVQDLARAQAPRPPAGVARLDLRLATDALVSSTDARDPGVASRVLLPGSIETLEGHGGISRSDEALDLTMATIRSKAVPPDERGLALRAATEVVAQTVDDHARWVLAGVCVVCLIGGVGGLVRRTLRRGLPWPPFSE